MSGAIPTRRSVKLQRLIRLPSKSTGNVESTTTYSDGTSCPNSPAVKKSYRLVVVGSAQTGKSAIVNRFLGKDFEDRYLPTIENFHRKLYKIRGDLYQLDVLDRSGNDPFPAARKLSYITGDIFIIVGAVDNAASIDQMIEIYTQIYECKVGHTCFVSKASTSKINGIGCIASSASSSSLSSTTVSGVSSSGSSSVMPVVFVLNKTDLPFHKWEIDSVDEVRTRIEQILSGSRHSDCFVACSAAINENVVKVFGRLFAIGKLPKYMNPELHRTLCNELSADRVTDSSRRAFANAGNMNNSFEMTKRPVLQRMRSKFSKDSDDEVIIDVNARRPSLRTDLLLNRAKSAAGSITNSTIYQSAAMVFDVGNGKTTIRQPISYTYNNVGNKSQHANKTCVIS